MLGEYPALLESDGKKVLGEDMGKSYLSPLIVTALGTQNSYHYVKNSYLREISIDFNSRSESLFLLIFIL